MNIRLLIPCLVVFLATGVCTVTARANEKPNILFCIADDWGYPHAGAYGDAVVRTPNFDRLAKEGILFQHAYVSSPSCTPSRGAILTGQWHWRLGQAGNLWCVWPKELVTYVQLLQQAGYAIGHSGKGWGPGRAEGGNPAGPKFRSFDDFYRQRRAGQPFCYWLGSGDPHRPYKAGSGRAAGLAVEKVNLPACYPDSDLIRSDIADYYFEVERFDRLVGRAIQLLKEHHELDRTIVVVTGDHGMPFPRGKSNLYDLGTRVPLVIRWGEKVREAQKVEDFVSLTDLAPTFLEAAGVEVPKEMTGRSLLPVLAAGKSGHVDEARSWILFGKERHVPAQEAPDMGGYPCRAIRTADFLYIRNYRPDRWPCGTPHYERAAIKGAWYADTDNGPTKSYIVEHRFDDAAHLLSYRLCFAKRPREELYDLRQDPGQVDNVAGEPEYEGVQRELSERLTAALRASGDPREVGGAEQIFDAAPYLGGAPKFPGRK